MGGATRQKQETLINAELKFQSDFAARTKELKAKLSTPILPIAQDFAEYKGFFVRDVDTFQLKTRSRDRDKQRLEFVRHAFHLYPVPEFMFNAWETPRQYAPRHRYDYEVRRPARMFDTKEDYRLWYICIATGGSFYKEYGSALFTKQESHIFLNCKHDLTIDQAIVYAIAYAESQNMGKALRIAKSKLNTFNLTDFWKNVIRFFARNEPKSKESIDDIVDYILYKQQETPDFTIIGKGHTLESLGKKVETWHQDLRRLKLIGEHFWEGIPVRDREYKQKNYDGTVNSWKFTQIKNAKDLQKEGNAMRHCVLGYKGRCISGQCSIWSLTLNEGRKLTLEVAGNAIVQVRGLANRLARPDEKNVVRKWAMDSGFYYK